MSLIKPKAKRKIHFPFTPQESQVKAGMAMRPYETTKINAFGGPKFGGKSWFIDWTGTMYGLTRPLMILIIGHKYEDMKALHVEPLERYLKPYIDEGLIKPFHATNKLFRIPKWGSVIKFQQVTNDRDARDLNGQAWDIVLIDEAQKLSPFSLSYLQGICRVSHTQSNWRKRLRTYYEEAKIEGNQKEMARLKQLWDDTYYVAKMMYCFNWGEKGHMYLKRLFWDGCEHPGDPHLRLDKFMRDEETGDWIEDPDDYRFIFAPMEGNEIGMKEDPGYVNRIKSMEEPYRTAYLTGDPTAFAGLMYEVHPHIHEVDIDAFLAKQGYSRDGKGFIPDHWSLYASLDAGANCSAGLYAKLPSGQSIQLSDYNADNKDAIQHIDEMVAEWKRCEWTAGRLPDYIFSDKYGFAKHERNSIMSHDITWENLFWNKHRLVLKKIHQDRVTSAQALKTALGYETNDEGKVTRKPLLLFAKKYTGKKDANGYKIYKRICEYTIDQIASLEPDEKRPDDWAHGPGIEDHAADKTKTYVLGAASPPSELPDRPTHRPAPDYGREKEYLDSIEDAEYEDISSFGSGGIGDYSS